MKKIIYGFIALVALMAFQSCQKDDDKVFEKSAAQRIQEAVDADKALLESASNGWEMRYYTGEGYNRGGYTMFMKFVNGKAYVSSDIAPSSMVTESSYDVLRGEGPVLTFNTHNTIMHFLAQPYQDDVTGEQGDYEFVIMRTTQDSIFVKGRKWGNKMVLTRVDAGKEWKSSIDKMQNVFHSMEYFYMENSENLEGVYFDPASRRAYIGVLGNSSISTAYTTTENGVEFKDSVEIAGKKVKTLSWNAQNQTLCLKDGSVLCSSYELPGYKRIDTYYGNWEVSYITKKATNEGEADEMGTFPISFSANTTLINQKSESSLTATVYYVSKNGSKIGFDLSASFSPLTGEMYIPYQVIEDPTGNYPFLLACTLNWNTGYFSATGFNLSYDSENDKYVITGENPDANTLVILPVDNSGNLVRNSEGQIQVYFMYDYLQSLKKVED